MKTILINGNILTPDELITSAAVVVEDNKILEVAAIDPDSVDGNVIDARGMYIVPGFIDLHIHGSHGFDTMDASNVALDGIAIFQANHGVTAFLPTTVTASADDTNRAILAATNARQPQNGAQILGIHLEGPYLDHHYCGAQPVQHLRVPDPNEYNPWLESEVVKLITVAPELPGTAEFIQAGVQKGIHFAIGHSNSSYEQMEEAVNLGLDQVTHIFNGMPPLHHRTPGILGAALTNHNVYAQVIVDGIHVHPAIVNLLVTAKGVDRIILITDSIRATGMPDGKYALGDQTVFVEREIARTAAGGLAGSTLTMEKAIANMMRFTGLQLSQVLPMATRVPAEALNLNSKGRLASGYDADLVILDNDLQVALTMVAGQVVYQKQV